MLASIRAQNRLADLKDRKFGIKEVYDDIWLVSFMDYDLGYFDLETRVLEPLENAFGPKCYLCLRNVVSPMSLGRTDDERSDLHLTKRSGDMVVDAMEGTVRRGRMHAVLVGI